MSVGIIKSEIVIISLSADSQILHMDQILLDHFGSDLETCGLDRNVQYGTVTLDKTGDHTEIRVTQSFIINSIT